MVCLLDPVVEAVLGQPLSPDHANCLRQAVADEIGGLAAGIQKRLILTTTPVRKRAWQLLEKEFPGVAVVSYQELSPEASIQALARISWPGTAAAGKT